MFEIVEKSVDRLNEELEKQGTDQHLVTINKFDLQNLISAYE